MEIPFNRTVCACERCTDCCKRQPGPLIEGDYERIRAHLQVSDEEMRKLFWASPGALVKNTVTGTVSRVGSITPRYRKGRCVFLDEHDRCKIHAVAPFGCAYFDTHMSQAASQDRSRFAVHSQESAEYQALRNKLPLATHYKPSSY